MADFIKLAATAVAETFDGTQEEAEALVAAYADEITIQQDETLFPAVTNKVSTVDVSDTEVLVTVTNTVPADVQHANVCTILVTHEAIAEGTLTVTVFDLEPVEIAVATTDDTATKVATAIRAGTYTGYTAGGTNATVTITQDADHQADAIINVLNQDGESLCAYKDNTIAWVSTFVDPYHTTETTEVWEDAEFAKTFTAAGS